MASFGDDESMTTSLYSSVQGSQPLKRFDPSIQKFTKIVIPTDLERLRQHRINIEKFQRQRNWDRLTIERINARQTVQQLKANIREMEKTRSYIIQEDLPSFDSRVFPVKEEAIHDVMQFIEMENMDQSPLGGASPIDHVSDEESSLRRHLENSDYEVINAEDTANHDTANQDTANHDTATTDAANHDTANSDDVTSTDSKEAELAHLMQKQIELQSKASMESWENLQNDLMSLNSVIHDFATHVRTQGETVDSIADNVDSAEKSVSRGRRYLIQASTLKAAVLPVGGAIIGGCLGGPVGLYAGMKVGTVVALGGSALGFIGGRFLKKRHDKKANLELGEMDGSLSSRRVSDSSGSLRSEPKKDR